MSEIVLKNVTSFGEIPATLETSKKVNLIYGLNGSGKTTISNFLYCKEKGEEFKDCRQEGMANEKILVYNQRFIQDIFYSTNEVKGIFTLSKENKDAEKAIRNAEEEKHGKVEEKREEITKKTKLENDKNDNLERIYKELWNIKTTYTGGDRPLEFCLKNKNIKKNLFNHIRNISKPPTKPIKTITTLENEAQAVGGKDVQKYDELPSIKLEVSTIEQDTIFSEVIIGNTSSPVANLIDRLNNSDWVRKGISYLPDEINADAEQCPFCQENTITEQLAKNIREYFNEIYEGKISKIKQYKTQYKQELLPPMEEYRNHPWVKERGDEFENIYNSLLRILEDNLLKIEHKAHEPSEKITLVATKDALEKLNDFICEINQKTKEHNAKIDNKAQTEQDIENEFWQIMRWEYDTKLNDYQTTEQTIIKKTKLCNRAIENIDSEIQKCDQEIANQQKNMVNIEEAIRNINHGLTDLGIDGFSIEKYQKHSYRIVRAGQPTGQFQTLSEGEKMIISFLYFMELCKGKETEEETDKEKIVMIDDPVSSLSHIYIFNISQWIERHFFKGGYKQVFVLTHSLYFFHELVRHGKNKGLFRITKSPSKGSQIEEIKQDEIKNEYESYWQVIKDHNEGKATDALMANCMRNILEHFFGFLGGSKLKEGLERLNENGEFSFFYRYIERESHSNAINITDNKEINQEHFKRAFKEVFSRSGHEDHYKIMMSEDNGASA